MGTALMVAFVPVLVWLGAHMGPSEANDWANTSGMPAFALAGLLGVWAIVRMTA